MMGADPARVPLFPLAGAILFPRAQLPPHIFEPRYRDLVRDARAGTRALSGDGGLRIGGLAQPIDVWYDGNRWVGLDTIVSGGRRLSYRLR